MAIPRLLNGPYCTPDCKVGDWLEDAVKGQVEVAGFTDAPPIHWPYSRQMGPAALILCGDLLRAVKTENIVSITHWFGPSAEKIRKWRNALGITRRKNNARGQRQDRFTDAEIRFILSEYTHRPAVEIARMLGRSAAGIAAYLSAKCVHKDGLRWSAREEAMLVVHSDLSNAELGKMLGRTPQAITLRRKIIGIARRRSMSSSPVEGRARWTWKEDDALRTAYLSGLAVDEIAKKMNRTVRGVYARAAKLRISRYKKNGPAR